MKSTHVRIAEDDNKRFRLAAHFVGIKNQRPISQPDMMKLLLDKFYECHGEAINAIKKVAEKSN